MRFSSDITLGERYVDEQTKIEGTAVAVFFYQHGCERVQLEFVNNGEIKEHFFDAPRLRSVKTGRRALTKLTGGPDHSVNSAPPRR